MYLYYFDFILILTYYALSVEVINIYKEILFRIETKN